MHPISYKSGQIRGRQKQVQPVAGVWNGVCRLQKHSKISVETFIGFLFIDCWMIIRWPKKIIDKNLLFLEVYECLMQYKQSPWMRFSRPFLLGNISNIPFFPVGHKLLLPQYVLECSSICGKARDRSQKKVVVFTLRGGSFLSDFSGIGLDCFLCWRLRTLAVCIIRLATKIKRPFEAAGEGCRENSKKSFFKSRILKIFCFSPLWIDEVFLTKQNFSKVVSVSWDSWGHLMTENVK